MVQVAVIDRTHIEEDGEELLAFDATPSQEATDEGELSRHPTEEGADVADHFRAKGGRLTLEVVLSDSPLSGTPEAGRARKLYERLMELYRSGQPRTIITQLRAFERMVLVSVRLARTPDTGDDAHLTLEFRQARLAKRRTVDVPPSVLKPKARASGQTEEALGMLRAAEAEAATQSAIEPPSEATPSPAASGPPRKSTAKMIADGTLFGG